MLIGNARRFTPRGSEQADVEDGRFDVTIIEDVSTVDLMGDAVIERLLGGNAAHAIRLQASSVDIDGRDAEPLRFSLDGEMIENRTLSLDVQPRTLRLVVGDGYDPDPDPEDR